MFMTTLKAVVICLYILCLMVFTDADVDVETSQVAHLGDKYGVSKITNMILCRHEWRERWAKGSFEIQLNLNVTFSDTEVGVGEYWLQVGKQSSSSIRNPFKMIGSGWRLSRNVTKRCSSGPSVFTGLTVMIMDREFIGHYNHFMEHVLGLWAAQHTFFPEAIVSRVIFLSATRSQALFRSGLHTSVNAQIIQALWPNASVLFSRNIHGALKSKAIVLENVVVSDRGGCHRNNITDMWGKMNAAHLLEIKDHLPTLRDRIYAFAGVQKPTFRVRACEKSKPQQLSSTRNLLNFPIPLLVIDRAFDGEDARRDLGANLKRQLYHRLKSMRVCIKETSSSSTELQYCNNEESRGEKVFNLSIVALQNLNFPDQVRVFSEAVYVIAIHGNGLTNLLWLSDELVTQKLLIEIFPESAFSLDYQMIGEMTGMNHYAFDAAHGVINKSRHLVDKHGRLLYIRPYDISNRLNSIIQNLNLTMFISDLEKFVFKKVIS